MGPWTVLRFAEEGHERFGHAKSELIIKLSEAPHQKFKRSQDDLIYSHKISLSDSLLSLPIHFETIDNEKIEVAIDQVISPSAVKILEGKGMPILNDDPLGPLKKSYQRGRLIIKFDIEFPQQLSEV